MHVVIINGSPRTEKLSNTAKILHAFGEGLTHEGATFETYAISDTRSWGQIRQAYLAGTEILMAMPVYTECVPGLLLEFLETLPRKDENTRISFLLQSGFSEGCQLRCAEAFVEKLPGYLGVRYGGCLVKGDHFCIRILNEDQQQQITKPYAAMGALFARGEGFFPREAKKFTGPETIPLPLRLLLQLIFKTTLKKQFDHTAAAWGCTVPLDARPWENDPADR